MVDYSKWDKLDVSDEEEAAPKPQVHRFATPQSVTIGGGGSEASMSVHQGADALEKDDDSNEPMELSDEEMANLRPDGDYREDVLQCRALAETALKQGNATEAVRLLEKALRLGGAQCPGLEALLRSAREQVTASNGSNAMADAEGGAEPGDRSTPGCVSFPESQPASGGSVGERYCWFQSKESVEINVFVPDDVKAKDVSIEVSDIKVRIRVRASTLWEGEWEYKVAPEEDTDWEMRNLNGRRAVRLTVKKAPLPGGMSIVVWWPRVLKGEPAIDVGKIPGRKLQATDSFVGVWKDAHAQFRERVKNHQPIPVELGNSEQQDHGDRMHEGGDGVVDNPKGGTRSTRRAFTST